MRATAPAVGNARAVLAGDLIVANGPLRVGTEVMPGTYVAHDAYDCYWERLDSAGDINDNYFGTALRVQVTIYSSDYSFSADEECGWWRRIG